MIFRQSQGMFDGFKHNLSTSEDLQMCCSKCLIFHRFSLIISIFVLLRSKFIVSINISFEMFIVIPPQFIINHKTNLNETPIGSSWIMISIT